MYPGVCQVHEICNSEILCLLAESRSECGVRPACGTATDVNFISHGGAVTWAAAGKLVGHSISHVTRHGIASKMQILVKTRSAGYLLLLLKCSTKGSGSCISMKLLHNLLDLCLVPKGLLEGKL